jgi:glycosyltransferase involved in cell wall biosynthesis
MSESSTSLSPETNNHLELTVLMPCLNESASLAICVHQTLEAMRAKGIRGEVLVADNGSTDGSQRIAAEQGARIVPIDPWLQQRATRRNRCSSRQVHLDGRCRRSLSGSTNLRLSKSRADHLISSLIFRMTSSLMLGRRTAIV